MNGPRWNYCKPLLFLVLIEMIADKGSHHRTIE